MKVLIIEDEMPAFRRLSMLLGDTLKDAAIEGPLQSVEEAVEWLSINTAPDLMFLDVQLADGISFAIFDQLDIFCPVIFTTAFDEYMLDAFRVNSIDYLLKPVRLDDLKKAIAKYQRLQQTSSPHLKELLQFVKDGKSEYKKRFLVRIGNRMEVVNTEEISHFTIEDKTVLLHTIQGKAYPMDQSLDKIEPSLDPSQFFRVNRQFLVKLESVQRIENDGSGKLLLTIQSKQNHSPQITVSKEKAASFKKWLDGV